MSTIEIHAFGIFGYPVNPELFIVSWPLKCGDSSLFFFGGAQHIGLDS